MIAQAVQRFSCHVLVLCVLLFRSAALVSQPRDGEPTGEVHGTVTLAAADEAHDPVAHSALFGRYAVRQGGHAALLMTSADTQDVPVSEKVVVYLEGEDLSRQHYPVPEHQPALNQHHLQFHPQVLPVMVGTTVRFPNQDNLFHNVFSYSQAKEFDLGRYPVNDSRSVTFDRPGIVRVYCDIHSSMNATILVLAHPFFATPEGAGHYRISQVPPGRYTLVFWCGREVASRRPVTIEAGSSLEVNFTH